MTKSEEVCKLFGIEPTICQYVDWRGDVRPAKGWSDFTNDTGRVQLLRLMKEKYDIDDEQGKNKYDDFLDYLWLLRGIGEYSYGIDESYILTDGPLVEAVLEWLRKEQK